MPPKVDLKRCIGCGVCVRVCHNLVFKLIGQEISSPELKRFFCEVFEQEKCTNCGKCVDECPGKALSI